MTDNKDKLHQDIYAIIDLGSNSFHMLMVREVANSVQVLARIKRKVRLASGLDDNFVLSDQAMARGWECLSLFAERLQDIPRENIRIVATATLRLAVNADKFVQRGCQIVNHPINIISGIEEARNIYLGVAYTSNCDDKKLVIDIGGASTEVIVGQQSNPIVLNSLDIGCVTFLERYYADGLLSQNNFDNAIDAACAQLDQVKAQYLQVGWKSAVGASGTVQAIQEIMISQGMSEEITLDRLLDIKQQAIAWQSIDNMQIQGLAEERKLVFVSGLSILIAIFKSLNIERMTLAGGALREGVLYSMLGHSGEIRKRTIESLIIRHHIDQSHAQLVADVAQNLAQQLASDWHLDAFEGIDVLRSAAMLHELGLIIEYRRYHKHGAYILEQSDLPGFTRAQQKLLTALVVNHRDNIDSLALFAQTMTSVTLAERLTRLLRIAIILSMRRLDDALPQVKIECDEDNLRLILSDGWLLKHPLMKVELEAEVAAQAKLGWSLTLN